MPKKSPISSYNLFPLYIQFVQVLASLPSNFLFFFLNWLWFVVLTVSSLTRSFTVRVSKLGYAMADFEYLTLWETIVVTLFWWFYLPSKKMVSIMPQAYTLLKPAPDAICRPKRTPHKMTLVIEHSSRHERKTWLEAFEEINIVK